MEKLIWNVIYHDINRGEICIFNVFKHSGFVADIKDHFRKCKTKEEFAYELRRSLLYFFWAKSEWEVLVSPWCGGRETEKKIDVYWQVMNNWDIFVDYVWSTHKER